MLKLFMRWLQDMSRWTDGQADESGRWTKHNAFANTVGW